MVVDVGALGKTNSNSWNLIHDDGWRGLLVEPRPAAAEKIRREFTGDYALEQVAVSDFDGTATLHMFPIKGWASLDENRAVRSGKKDRWRRPAITVDVTTLPALLVKHDVPHRFGVLSVDVEGLELKVISPMLSTLWRPDFILVEDTHGDFDTELLQGNGYQLLLAKGHDKIWQRLALTSCAVAGYQV